MATSTSTGATAAESPFDNFTVAAIRRGFPMRRFREQKRPKDLRPSGRSVARKPALGAAQERLWLAIAHSQTGSKHMATAGEIEPGMITTGWLTILGATAIAIGCLGPAETHLSSLGPI